MCERRVWFHIYEAAYLLKHSQTTVTNWLNQYELAEESGRGNKRKVRPEDMVMLKVIAGFVKTPKSDVLKLLFRRDRRHVQLTSEIANLKEERKSYKELVRLLSRPDSEGSLKVQRLREELGL